MRMLHLLSVFLIVAGAFPAMAADGGRASVAVADFPGALLPDGATRLLILPAPTDTRGGQWRLDYGDDSRVYGTLRFSGDINPAKMIAYYDTASRLVTVWTQLPFSARYCSASYRWQRRQRRLTLVRERQGDPSREQLRRAERLLAQGNLTAAAAELDGMLYPRQYYADGEMQAKFFKRAHQLAVAARRRAGDTGAAQVMDRYRNHYELLLRPLVTNAAQLADSRTFAAFGCGAALTCEEYAALVSDWAGFLTGSGRAQAAVPILRAVLRLAPDHTAACRQLGDALWTNAQEVANYAPGDAAADALRAEARDCYQRYVVRMTAAGAARGIPQYLTRRLLPMPAGGSPAR
ncbi:MAG TPA: hypothetical protein PKM88_14155 [bacterium]|nr:hypothetical protein [bacterium]